jgi:hypothetical protein
LQYQFPESDQFEQLPVIQSIQNPTYLKNDWYVQHSNIAFRYYYVQLVAILASQFSTQRAVASIYAISLCAALTGAYFLVKHLFHRRDLAGILAEEVVTRAEMWHIKNELKELVTGEWVRVNPKGIAAYRQRNQINIVFSSNEHQPLPIENDDRRHCVIWTPDPVGREFYEEVREEIANGGIEAFYHHLLNLDPRKTKIYF